MPNKYNQAQKKITKECIVQALVLLLKKKKPEDFTISELCKKAGVSRMAFYRHFRSINDVLEFYFSEQQISFFTDLANHKIFDVTQMGINFLTTVKQEKELYTSFFSANLHWLLIEQIANGLHEYNKRFKPGSHSEDMEYQYKLRYEAGGFVCVLAKWLERNCADPTENIMEWFSA